LANSFFFKALKWSVAAELVSKALQPLIFVVLARLLTPSDYGVVAAAAIVISFTQIFWESGMAKALIQRQTEIDESSNVAFWINIAMGILFSLLLFLFADYMANVLFHDQRVGVILKFMTLQIFFGALASVHTALLQKELRFDRLFWVKLVTVGVPGLFSIPLAIAGFSYWALVIGTVAGQLAQVIILWNMNKWRPSFTFNTRVAKTLSTFGLWVGVTGLLAWFFIWADSLFVGSYLGSNQLGLYRTGNQFVMMVYGLFFAPLLPVLYSHFSGMQSDRERLRNTLFKVTRIATFISIPMAFLIFTLAEPISLIVFGEKWNGIGFILGVMALSHGYAWVVGANGEIYRAIGKPSYESIITFIMLGVYLAGYYISIQKDFETFVWTRLGLSLTALVPHLLLGWLAIQISVFSILRVTILATLIGCIAPLVHMGTVRVFDHVIVQGFITGTVSVLIMAALLYILEKNGSIKDVINLIKKREASG
jgi:O-antigen/teichoic acid export membrane protein